MTPLTRLMGLTLGGAALIACAEPTAPGPGPATPAGGCSTSSCSLPVKGKTMQVNNADFYKEGKFDSEKAKAAYFAMMTKLGAPVYDVYKNKKDFFWAIDFNQNNFAAFGMAGVFWCNEKEEGYFGHEIFLLPGQSIAEHRHVPSPDGEKTIRAKVESWQVRYGSVYGFSEVGEPNLDKYPEVKALLSKEHLNTLKSLHVEKWDADGEVYKLAQVETWHFMMGGPDGAVVSEYATFHDNAGLRFSNPNVKF